MILDGRGIRDKILDVVRTEVNKLDCRLKLVVIQIGNDYGSNIYVNQKNMMCSYVGFDFEHINLDDSVNTDGVIKLIDKLNNDNSVTGIMVELPLPDYIDKDKVLNSISYLKDVDGLTDINRDKLINGEEGLFSCTSLGVIELLNRYNISFNNKNVVIIGRSNLVGRPIGIMISSMGGNVIFCHSKTEDISKFTKNADIIISAVGKPKLITGDMINNHSVIIDVGISMLDNKICGDVDFDSVVNKCSYITPVPYGVGAMTIAMLAKNIIKAYKLQK